MSEWRCKQEGCDFTLTFDPEDPAQRDEAMDAIRAHNRTAHPPVHLNGNAAPEHSYHPEDQVAEPVQAVPQQVDQAQLIAAINNLHHGQEMLARELLAMKQAMAGGGAPPQGPPPGQPPTGGGGYWDGMAPIQPPEQPAPAQYVDYQPQPQAQQGTGGSMMENVMAMIMQQLMKPQGSGDSDPFGSIEKALNGFSRITALVNGIEQQGAETRLLHYKEVTDLVRTSLSTGAEPVQVAETLAQRVDSGLQQIRQARQQAPPPQAA